MPTNLYVRRMNVAQRKLFLFKNIFGYKKVFASHGSVSFKSNIEQVMFVILKVWLFKYPKNVASKVVPTFVRLLAIVLQGRKGAKVSSERRQPQRQRLLPRLLRDKGGRLSAAWSGTNSPILFTKAENTKAENSKRGSWIDRNCINS